MGNIKDMLGLGQPGASQAQAIDARKSQMAGSIMPYWQQILPELYNRFQGESGLYDQLYKYAPNLSQTLSPEATDQRIAAFGNAANENAANSAQNDALLERSQGWGDGASIGKTRGYLNNAQRQTNQYSGWEHSPQGYAANYSAAMEPYNKLRGWSQQDWQTLMNLGGLVMGQPQAWVGTDPMQYFAEAAGAAAK